MYHVRGQKGCCHCGHTHNYTATSSPGRGYLTTMAVICHPSTQGGLLQEKVSVNVQRERWRECVGEGTYIVAVVAFLAPPARRCLLDKGLAGVVAVRLVFAVLGRQRRLHNVHGLLYTHIPGHRGGEVR
jgi:uncharacterized OB-fold protein